MLKPDHSPVPSIMYPLDRYSVAAEAADTVKGFTQKSPLDASIMEELLHTLPDNLEGQVAQEILLAVSYSQLAVTEEQMAWLALGATIQAKASTALRQANGE